MNNFWKFIPPELAHNLAPVGLKLYSSVCGGPTPVWREFTWHGLQFKNPLGVAGGVDKNADNVLDWQSLGAGFVEVGTVTPRPQDSNPKPILARDWHKKILWNKMGFPNAGSQEVFANLEGDLPELEIPVFVNLGKNRNTEKHNTIADYRVLAAQFSKVASALVLNISSPNTKGLRDFQERDELEALIRSVVTELSSCEKAPPIIVKLSPDLSKDQLQDCLETALKSGATGINLTNTTLSRPKTSKFPTEGGLAGSFLKDLSLQKLEICQSILGKSHDYLIISTGGIFSANDIQERFNLGAKLVQVYSALVFEGPLFFQKMARHFQHLEGKHSQ